MSRSSYNLGALATPLVLVVSNKLIVKQLLIYWEKIYGSSPSPPMYLSKMLSTFMQAQLQNLYNIIIVKEKSSFPTTCNWLLFVIVLKFSCNYIFAKSCFWRSLIVYITSLQLMLCIFYHMDDPFTFFIQRVP